MTNAFGAYAISVMLTNATVINKALDAPLREPMTTNAIDAYRLAPTVWGVDGYFEMKHRFFVTLRGSRIVIFNDAQNSVKDYRNEVEAARKVAKWGGETNRLSNEEALAIARHFLFGIGIDDKDKGLDLLAPTVQQDEITVEATGKVMKYPRYNLRWRYEPAGDNGGMEMTVYATTKSVVYYEGIVLNIPLAPLPVGYYDMIGLPKNIDTNWSLLYRPPKLPVPVLEKVLGGMPRRLIVPGLTNSPAKN
jgi:hypothetical protein